jgi:hypothetical protein
MIGAQRWGLGWGLGWAHEKWIYGLVDGLIKEGSIWERAGPSRKDCSLSYSEG